MKILQIEDEPWDSGIAHYALTLSAALKARGHEVHFWGDPRGVPLQRAAAAGLPTSGVDRPWLSLPELRSKVRACGIELINAHTGSAHSLALALAAGSSLPVVRTRGDARAPKGHALARALAGRTSAFIAANSRIAGHLRGIFGKTRVELILQGIADEGGAPPLPEGPIFGILGRLDVVKGHEFFITAAQDIGKSHPRAGFLAAGNGRAQRRQALERRPSPCRFLGFVPDPGAFRTRCSVGVVASIGSEAVSRAALEWLACGRPVVATTVGGLPDIIEDGVTGFLVPPSNAHALAAAMKRFIDDPGLAARLGAQARRRYEDRFGLERFARDTERLYEEIRHLPS
jgi:glycosyltransferase involved in cell wall biosynthesis